MVSEPRASKGRFPSFYLLLAFFALSAEEFEVMKTHAAMGAEKLEAVQRQFPGNTLLDMGIAIAKFHHEKWNGEGYPQGLPGEAIPLSARIMAVVDVYEALRAKRPYKEALSHEESVDIIVSSERTSTRRSSRSSSSSRKTSGRSGTR